MGLPNKPFQRNNVVPDRVVFVLCYICFHILAFWMLDSSMFLLYVLNTALLMSWIVVRILRLIVEFYNWRFMYTSYKTLLQRCFKMHYWPSFVLTLSTNIAFILIYWNYGENEISSLITGKYYSLADILVCLLFLTMGLYFQWVDSPLTESYRAEQHSSFSGGCCMAFGYFNGYLKIILPGILKKVNVFQAGNQLNNKVIPEKKLFILIPSSSCIFDKPHENGRATIEPMEESLEPHEQDRGMILNRVYKNQMYKIKSKKNNKKTKYYVLLEGASPLKTFKETFSCHVEFKEFKQEVISSFYYTLEQLLSEEKEMRDLVELVYYNDERNPDIDIGDVIRERFKYLKRTRQLKEKKLNNT